MSTTTVTGVGWLYVRIYLPGGDDTDALLPEIALWLEAARERWPTRSAHFLRFVDLRGHHVRLRLQAEPDVLDEIFANTGVLEARARAVPVRSCPRLVPDPLTGVIGGRAGLAYGVYGPEYDKYGGMAGVEAAEQHFDVSSRWCLDNRVWQLPRPAARVALAARFLALAAASGPLAPAELLGAHLRTWGSRLPTELRDGVALQPLVEEVLSVGLDQEPQWQGVAATISDLADDAGRTVRRIGAGADARRAIDLLHIDVNRLGLNPAEECVAGICARQLVGSSFYGPRMPA